MKERGKSNDGRTKEELKSKRKKVDLPYSKPFINIPFVS